MIVYLPNTAVKDEGMRGVIIAYPSEKLALQLKRELIACGVDILAVCIKGNSVLNIADAVGEAVVVCPFILPDMPAHHLAEILPGSFDIIALSKAENAASTASNLSVLPLPLNRGEFLSLVNTLCRQSTYTASQRRQRTSGEKAVLDRAKFILMEQKGFSESQAHKFLQRSAMNRGLKISVLAQRIADGEIKIF